MEKMPSDIKIRSRKDIVWKVMDGEGILLHLKSGDFFKLNDTGLKIWKLTNGQRTIGQISALLVRDSKFSPKTINQETEKFFRTLFRHNLVEKVDSIS